MAVGVDQTTIRPGPSLATPPGWIGVAGLTSLGAGAIHAAAIGVHAEHRPAALAFTVLASAQLGWGGLALVRRGAITAALGAVIGISAIAGWAMAKAAGIPFINGLDAAEPVQTADLLAVGLALASVAFIAISLRGRPTTLPPLATHAAGIATHAAAVGVAAVAMFGMVSTGTHVHAEEVAAGHAHGQKVAQPAAAVAPVPYDPTKPIDLGGVPGVTPKQQADAENLVSVTLLRLPQWSDPAVAEAAGFRSIGDGRTGVEHFVHQGFIGDDVILDPDQPESLVYDTKGGGRRLVAAMYMLQRGTPIEDVPDIGGGLIQWHTHTNLCYNAAGKIAGLTDAAGNCPAGLIKPVPTPMIHVWIQAHKCGPFAALEGIGGGTIKAGESVLCDHAHGA